jgi:broad specificity phosphatase PhoE
MIERIMTKQLVSMLLFVSLLPNGFSQNQEVKGTTVIVVRHAEKVDDSVDPDLSERGRERAVRLAQMLAEADVAALFSSQYKRTRQTLLPLAEMFKLKIFTVHASKTEELVERMLSECPGKTIVVASHSDKVTSIIEALGGSSVGYLDEAEYDSLFVATLLDDSKADVLQLKF